MQRWEKVHPNFTTIMKELYCHLFDKSHKLRYKSNIITSKNIRVCKLLNEYMNMRSFQKCVGALPENNIILQSKKTEKTDQLPMQYLIATLLFETNILRNKMRILGLSVLSYSVSHSHTHLRYPFCEEQSCPAVVRATSWHRLAIVHKVQLFLWRNSCTKWDCDRPGQWYGTPHGSNPFTRLYFHLGMIVGLGPPPLPVL